MAWTEEEIRQMTVSIFFLAHTHTLTRGGSRREWEQGKELQTPSARRLMG